MEDGIWEIESSRPAKSEIEEYITEHSKYYHHSVSALISGEEYEITATTYRLIEGECWQEETSSMTFIHP